MRNSSHVLAIRTYVDPVLGWIAPVGLAAAAGTALVLDLEPDGLAYPGRRTVAGLLEDGPTRPELAPERPGVAVVAGGGVGPAEVGELVEQLSAGWPSIVIRVGEQSDWPVVPVFPVLAGHLLTGPARAGVWQLGSFLEAAPGPGPVLPPLGRSMFRRLLRLEVSPNNRWVRAWRRVWDLPWH